MTQPAQNPRPAMPPFHPSRMVLLVERASLEGAVLLGSPHLPGWQVCVRGPFGLARGLEEAWREHAVRAYANSHGEEYDATGQEPAASPPVQTDSGEWRELADGRWTSPTGHVYRADSKMVAQVRALQQQRAAAG